MTIQQVKRVYWTVTPAGRRLARTIAVLASAGGFMYYYLPNTFLKDQYKNFTQLYRKGLAVPVTPKVKSLAQEVMDDLGMSSVQQKFVSLYTGFGYDLFRAGSTMVNSGCVLGVPVSFRYSTPDDFETAGVLVQNKPVPWSSAEGESLKQSLIFSDEAKKFALAREISHLTTAEPFALGISAAAVIGTTYTIGNTTNTRMNFYARPRSLRLILYGLVSFFGYAMWAFMEDFTTVYYESEADMTVAGLGEKYAKGGLEYYEKILQRNVALRALMGDEGDRFYTAYGNDQLLIRTKHIPFTHRRDYLKSRVEEYEMSKKEAKTDDVKCQDDQQHKEVQEDKTSDLRIQVEGCSNEETEQVKSDELASKVEECSKT